MLKFFFFFLPLLTRCLANFYILQSYQLKKVNNPKMFFLSIPPPNLCVPMLRWHLWQMCLFLTGKTLLELVIEQFEDLLVRILLLAACISFVSIKQLFSLQKVEWPGNKWCLLGWNIIYGGLSCVSMVLFKTQVLLNCKTLEAIREQKINGCLTFKCS